MASEDLIEETSEAVREEASKVASEAASEDSPYTSLRGSVSSQDQLKGVLQILRSP